MEWIGGARIGALSVLVMVCGLGGLAACEQAETEEPALDTTAADSSDVVEDGAVDSSADVPEEVLDVPTEELVPDVPPEPIFSWTEWSLGDEGEIGSLHVSSAQEAYAASGERVLRFNGSVWVTYGEPFGGRVHAVTRAGDEVIAVGVDGLIARRAIGTMRWESEASGVDVTLRAIAHRSNGELLAVGDGSTILHYAPGDGWTISHDGGTLELRSVWAPLEGEGVEGALAVGSKGTLYRHAGDLWVTEQIAPGDVALNAVLGEGERRFAVGSAGTISVKKNANSPWQLATSNLTDHWDLHSIASSGEDDIRAVGDHGAVIGYDGDKWSVEHVVGPHHVVSDLVAVGSGVDEEGALHWMALAEDGGGLMFDGQNWVDMSTRPDAGIRALAGEQRDALWACGPGGLLMATSEQGWTSLDSGTNEDLNDIALSETGDVYVVGAAATVLKISDQGEVSSISVPAATGLLAVAAHQGELVVGGKGGTVLRGDLETETFSFWNTGMSWDVHAITVDADGAWWLAGGFASLRRSTDGETAEVISAPISGALQDLAPHQGGVLIVGDNGAILNADAQGAELAAPEQPATFLYGLHARAEEAWAVGYPGVALRYDASSEDGWTPMETDSKLWFEAVWSDEEGAIVAGRSGTLLQWSEVP